MLSGMIRKRYNIVFSHNGKLLRKSLKPEMFEEFNLFRKGGKRNSPKLFRNNHGFQGLKNGFFYILPLEISENFDARMLRKCFRNSAWLRKKS